MGYRLTVACTYGLHWWLFGFLCHSWFGVAEGREFDVLVACAFGCYTYRWPVLGFSATWAVVRLFRYSFLSFSYVVEAVVDGITGGDEEEDPTFVSCYRLSDKLSVMFGC